MAPSDEEPAVHRETEESGPVEGQAVAIDRPVDAGMPGDADRDSGGVTLNKVGWVTAETVAKNLERARAHNHKARADAEYLLVQRALASRAAATRSQ